MIGHDKFSTTPISDVTVSAAAMAAVPSTRVKADQLEAPPVQHPDRHDPIREDVPVSEHTSYSHLGPDTTLVLLPISRCSLAVSAHRFRDVMVLRTPLPVFVVGLSIMRILTFISGRLFFGYLRGMGPPDRW